MKVHMRHYDFHKAEKASDHVRDMEALFPSEIEESVNKSSIYRSCADMSDGRPTDNYAFELMTTSDAVAKYAVNDGKRVCALNYASFRHPGGGFLGGSVAQEEMLCHDSTLFNVLNDARFAPEYRKNQTRQNGGMYEDFAIYSPGIIFKVDKGEYRADVLTCPSPNFKEGEKNGISYDKNRKVFRQRLEFMLNVAKKENAEILILGAWGCGVFRQNVDMVALDFKDALRRWHFDKVVFAVPTDDKLNAFRKNI